MILPETLTLSLSADQQTDVFTAIEELMAYVDTPEQAHRLGEVANRLLEARGEAPRIWWEA